MAFSLTVKVQPGKFVEGRKKGERLAEKSGRPVSLLQPVMVHRGGKLRQVWTTFDTIYPVNKATNPLFSFKKFYVTCDGKKFGPFNTKAKANKVAVSIARVLDKPAKILGQAGAATNPKRKCAVRRKRNNPTRQKTKYYVLYRPINTYGPGGWRVKNGPYPTKAIAKLEGGYSGGNKVATYNQTIQLTGKIPR